jgi:PadR family transcriptional regulator, regulatory protein AphA
VAKPSTSTYALLGLLGIQSWTSYELTQQARRSLRWAWPRSEAHLYAEQKRLVRLGWARSKAERIGRRSRTRYEITPKGRKALRDWLATEPSAVRFEIEGVLRLLFAEHGSLDDLRRSLEVTAREARSALDDGLAQLREYLETGGPFPERLNLIALSSAWFTDSLALLEDFCLHTARAISGWEDASGPEDLTKARREISDVFERHSQSSVDG